MALFHFNSDKELSLNMSTNAVNKSNGKIKTAFDNTVWKDEFSDDSLLNDTITITDNSMSKKNKKRRINYDKEFETLNKTNPQLLKQYVKEFINGNFDVINSIKNPVEFLEAYRKESSGETMYSAMISAYKEGKITSDKIVGYLDTLQLKFFNYEYEYDEYNPDSKLGTSNLAGGYSKLFNRVKKYFQREKELKENYKNNRIDRKQVNELQIFISQNYNIELSEIAAAEMINEYKRINGGNLEKLKSDCLKGDFNYAGEDCRSYLENILTYPENGYNDSLESLNDVAKTMEIEYGRYNFDIHNSQIADLAYRSEKMINEGEKFLKITENDDKIVIRNKHTGKERVIDLNRLTSKLDTANKMIFLDALSEFNKISLWEFAVEVTGSLDTNIKYRTSLAEYCVETDSISIGNELDSNTLLHEMIHAMMTTIIEGKNTANEFLFKELVDTFNEEQKIHSIYKQLRNSIIVDGNYTSCAENLNEFAAEAGCLWLSGKSDSEFTIATHFPKSYRLLIQLIEKIRAQETGRSINE